MAAPRFSLPLRLFVFTVLAGGLVLTGCRTYGGYDTEPETYRQIQKTVKQVERDLQRAESDLRRLKTAAGKADTLDPLTARYASLVERHKQVLAEHRGQAASLSKSSSYRTLHRTYGAMVTDRRLLKRQYARTVRAVWATARDEDIPRKSARAPSTYSITPINFPRVRYRGPLTMTEALQEIEGTPVLEPEEPGGEEE